MKSNQWTRQRLIWGVSRTKVFGTVPIGVDPITGHIKYLWNLPVICTDTSITRDNEKSKSNLNKVCRCNITFWLTLHVSFHWHSIPLYSCTLIFMSLCGNHHIGFIEHKHTNFLQVNHLRAKRFRRELTHWHIHVQRCQVMHNVTRWH